MLYTTKLIETPNLKATITETFHKVMIDTQIKVNGKWTRLELMYSLKEFKEVYKKSLTL